MSPLLTIYLLPTIVYTMPCPYKHTHWQSRICELTELDLLRRYDVEGYTTVAGTPALNGEPHLQVLPQSFPARKRMVCLFFAACMYDHGNKLSIC